jgi:hypothetical protein
MNQNEIYRKIKFEVEKELFRERNVIFEDAVIIGEEDGKTSNVSEL